MPQTKRPTKAEQELEKFKAKVAETVEELMEDHGQEICQAALDEFSARLGLRTIRPTENFEVRLTFEVLDCRLTGDELREHLSQGLVDLDLWDRLAEKLSCSDVRCTDTSIF